MCVLFVGGAMNLVWVAALTSFVVTEKIGPAAAAMVLLGGHRHHCLKNRSDPADDYFADKNISATSRLDGGF